jgi:hypothetical protein
MALNACIDAPNRLSYVQTGGENDIPLNALTRRLHFTIQGWISDDPCSIAHISTQLIQAGDGSDNGPLRRVGGKGGQGGARF